MSEGNAAPLALWNVGSTVYSVSVCRDGVRVASGSHDNYVRVWDVRTGALVLGPLKGHTKLVRSVAFSPDNTRIVSGSWDHTIRIWDAHTGAPIGEPLTGHTGDVNSVAFSHDSTLIISGSDDKTVRLWDARTGTSIGDPINRHSGRVWSVAFSHDGTRVVSGSYRDIIRIWDARTGTSIGEPLQRNITTVCSVAFSHDGTRIVSGSYDETIRILEACTGTLIGEPLRGHTGQVYSVAFSHDSTRIVSGSTDNTIRIWDALTGTPIGEPLKGYTSTVYSVAFSPDSTRIFSGSLNGTIAVWQVPQISPSFSTGTSEREPFPPVESTPMPVYTSAILPRTQIQQLPGAQVDTAVKSKKAPQRAPSFDTVSSNMSAQEMFECLVNHGCTDLTSSMDADRCSSAVIASGGFGDVRRVALHDGTFVALKTLRLHILRTGGDKGVKRAVREVYLWSRLCHPHIQELLGVIVFQGGLGMVSPWREHGNLQDYIAAHPDVVRHPLCVQLASAVSYLHSIDMVHGDLKSINVLVANDGTLKISDFDYAIRSDTTLQFSATTRPGGGTLRWMAPELFQLDDDDENENEPAATRTKQTDVYALGMTMLEIVTGTVSYSEYQSEGKIYRAIHAKKPPRRPKVLSATDEGAEQMWQLLLRCWDHDPSARPGASSVLASVYGLKFCEVKLSQ